jgi:twitching motility protein PilT
LLKRTGRSRVLCMEIMRTNNAIRNLIREEKLEQVYSTMQVGQTESGMFTMNQSLAKLVADGTVSEETAVECSAVPDELIRILTGMGTAKKK